MRIKKMLLFSFLLLFLRPALPAQGLIIRMQDGSENQMMISSVRKLGFSNDQLVVTPKTGAPDYYDIYEVSKLYFGVIASVLPDLPVTPGQFAVIPNPSDNEITLLNIPSGSSVINIFSLEGRMVQQAKVSSGEHRINISALKRGIYFISASGQTAKFVKL